MGKQLVNTDLSPVNRQRFRAFQKIVRQRTRTSKNCLSMYGKTPLRVDTFFFDSFFGLFLRVCIYKVGELCGRVCDMRVGWCVCDKRVVIRGLETRVKSVTVFLVFANEFDDNVSFDSNVVRIYEPDQINGRSLPNENHENGTRLMISHLYVLIG